MPMSTEEEKKGRGNPFYMRGRGERIKRLLSKIEQAKSDNGGEALSEEMMNKILALFAINEDLRLEKVQEYVELLKTAGLI